MKNPAFIAILLLISATATAQNAVSKSTQNGVTGLELYFKRGRDYDSGLITDNLKISFNSRSVYETGKKYKDAKLDVSNDVSLANGAPGLLFSFINGSGTTSGSYFDSTGITPFRFGAKTPPFLNVAFNLGLGTDDTKPTDLSLAIQTVPRGLLTALGFRNIANWAVIGVAETGHWENGQTGTNLFEAVYRTYASHAIWKADLTRETPDAATWAFQHVPTWKSAVNYFKSKKPSDEHATPADPGYLESLVWLRFNDILAIKPDGHLVRVRPNDEARARQRLHASADVMVTDEQLLSDEQWQTELNVINANVREASVYFPELLLYGEAQGSYSLTKEIEQRRYNSLWAVGCRYNIARQKNAQAIALEIRYEHGFTNAHRASGVNGLSASINVKF